MENITYNINSTFFILILVIIVIIIYFNAKNSKIKISFKKSEDAAWKDENTQFIITESDYIRSKENFLFEPKTAFYNLINRAKIDSLNYAAIILTNHSNINETPKIKKFTSDMEYKEKNKLGIYKDNIIYININKLKNRYVLGAVLCHELSHYYLSKENIKNKYNEDIEKITDLTAVFLGWGKLILNGYVPQKKYKNNKTYNEIVGYLTIADIADIFARFCLFYNISQEKAFQNLLHKPKEQVKSSLENIKEWKESMKDIIHTENNNLKTDNKITMKCYKCKKKLRFPEVKKEILIKCPKCGNEFKVLAKKQLYL